MEINRSTNGLRVRIMSSPANTGVQVVTPTPVVGNVAKTADVPSAIKHIFGPSFTILIEFPEFVISEPTGTATAVSAELVAATVMPSAVAEKGCVVAIQILLDALGVIFQRSSNVAVFVGPTAI